MAGRIRLIVEKDEAVPVRVGDDVVRARQAVRALATAAGFSLVDQTKIITAASEIARNTVDYGGGGDLRLELLRDGGRRGVRLTFTDQGPGIADVEQALKDGYTSGGGLGLGLGGARRLVGEFAINSSPGRGTKVTLTRWK
jgi:serine/threonine-protein kinase RsbT